MRLARLAAIALAIALVSISFRALAAPRVTIVVRKVTDTALEAFETHLRAELLTMGFEVLTLPEPPASVTPEAIEAIAERTQAIAAIIVEQPEGSITGRLWITERVTGKTLIRTVRPEKMSPEAPTIFALRAVELLRASLLELQESHPPRGTVPVPVEVKKLVPLAPQASASAPAPIPGPAPAPAPSPGWRPERRPAPPPASQRWMVSAGLRLMGGPGGMPLGLGPAVALGWYPKKPLAIQVQFTGPFYGQVEEGASTATTNQLTIGARVRWGLLQGKVVPYLAAGAGAHYLSVSGTAAAPSRGVSNAAWSPYGSGAVGVSLRPSQNFGFILEGEALVTTAKQNVVFGSRTVASAGRPLFAVTAGVEASW